MNLTPIRTFIAIAHTGGFHAAAERLNITQAAVSARIKTLETQLGQRLFERGRNGAELTPAGKQLLPHAESMTRNWDHAVSMLGVPISENVPLRIGAQFSVWAPLALDWAAWIGDTLPEVAPDLKFDFSSNMLKSLVDGQIDVVLTHELAPDQRLQTRPLPEEEMVLVARRASQVGSPQMPPHIGLDWGAQLNEKIARIAERLPKARLSVSSGILGLRYLLDHDGCAYVPQRLARMHLRQKRLFRVKRAPKFSISGFLVYRNDNRNLQYLERSIEGFRGLHHQDSPKDSEYLRE